LADLLQTLSPDEQQIVLLRFVEELEYHEIATALDVPIGTVKWRIHATRSKLVAASEGRRDEPGSIELATDSSR
jgi:RNA polymerase sigma-70 factor (ECF subfamily)